MIEKIVMAARSEPRAAAKKTASDSAVAQQQTDFDHEMEERAELEREANVLRDMMLAQLKADDQALRKYITLI